MTLSILVFLAFFTVLFLSIVDAEAAAKEDLD